MSSYTDLANRSILNQPIYEAGRPIDVVARELGIDPSGVLKLASNENPLGPSPLGIKAAKKALESSQLYPDAGATFLREKLAKFWCLDSNNFIIGNGSNELIILLAQAFLRPNDEVIYGTQSFVVYKLASMLFGATSIEISMPQFKHDLRAMRNAVSEKTRIIFIANPNNPTGGIISPSEILEFANSLPEDVIFCLDEAYAEYLDETADLIPLIRKGRKVVSTRTFSKAYGLAGLRIGYLIGSPEVCSLLNRIRQPFNVNSLALAAAEAALDDDLFLKRTRSVNADGITQLSSGLNRLGITYLDSKANFIAAKIPHSANVFSQLQREGIILRPLQSYGMIDWMRITVGTQSQNKRLLSELEKIIL